jgi:acetyl-CoA carboxylase biotin carboxyl carrier protein
MDEKSVLAMIEAFNKGSMTELEYVEGNIMLKLRKGQPTADSLQADPARLDVTQGVTLPATTHLAMPAQAAPMSNQPEGEAITSPLVGTFYAAPGPDAPPFVSSGSKVKAGQTLCILEAMKMMNHLDAEFDAEILSIEAKTGDVVEYGQTLFMVKRL